ncbi:MAG TPA: CUB domain-containing protein, partial [Bacteroidia bacterium]|nr:CUB domain-containing protein [Bacteroidia bacterium]
MKQIFGFLFASCLSLAASAQSYPMSNTSVSTCTGNFFDSGGFSSNYGNNQNLTMTFTSPNGNRMVMTFNSLYLEVCCDHLYIYDGPSAASPLIGNYFSNPGTITATGTSLTFVFTSDNINTNAGWDAVISCGGPALTIFNMSSSIDTTCAGYLFDDGGINGNYSDNQDVVQTFSSGTSDQLYCDFTSTTINLQSGDTLFVYDGATTGASPLAIYVTGSHTEDFITSGSNLTFRFKSDGSTNGTGWAIILTCTTAAAIPGYYTMSSGTRYVCDGYFYDSGGAGYYGNNENLTQTFTSYNGNRL